MSSIAFSCAAVVIAVLLGFAGVRAVSSDSMVSRILAIDTAALLVIAGLALFSYWQGVSYYLDAALVLALLAFVGTLGAARFHGEGRLY
jgi:multicomponent Na+:H+ antiporter subunit F